MRARKVPRRLSANKRKFACQHTHSHDLGKFL
jgi:hypothetical protein